MTQSSTQHPASAFNHTPRHNIIQITLLILFTCVLAVGCGQSEGRNDVNEDVVVSAPTGMTAAIEALSAAAEKEIGVEIVPLFASGSEHVGRIIEGTPSDVVITDQSRWMNQLEEKNLLVNMSRATLAGNALVLATRIDALEKPLMMDDLSRQQFHPIAMAQPESVSMGDYAKQALQRAMIWSQIQNKITYARHSDNVVDNLITGKGKTGFIYATDVHEHRDTLETIFVINPTMHDPIRYEIARLRDATNVDAARRFMDWLQSESAQTILKTQGYKPQKN